jgi:hypothetical protein
MRRTGLVIGAGMLATVVTIGWAGPAGAGIAVRPDLTVRAPGGSFVGNDIYNESGENQTVDAEVDFGDTITYRVRVENDGLTPSAYRLRGTASAPGTRIRYFIRTQNVSRPMKHDGALSPVLAPGQRMVVKVLATATDDQNDTDTFFVRADSLNVGVFDVVKVEVNTNPLG